MARRLRFTCPSCKTSLAPIEASDHATVVVRRTCRKCRDGWQLVVSRLPTTRDGLTLDRAILAFVGRRPKMVGLSDG